LPREKEGLACGRCNSFSCRHSAKLDGVHEPTTRSGPRLNFLGPRETMSSSTSILRGDLRPSRRQQSNHKQRSLLEEKTKKTKTSEVCCPEEFWGASKCPPVLAHKRHRRQGHFRQVQEHLDHHLVRCPQPVVLAKLAILKSLPFLDSLSNKQQEN